MSRNLGTRSCYFCDGAVLVSGEPHAITEQEAGVYLSEYQGMMVALADCSDCGARYLAWLDDRTGLRPTELPQGDRTIGDLSFRSTFDDEPGAADLPEFVIETERWRVASNGTRTKIGPTTSNAQQVERAREVYGRAHV